MDITIFGIICLFVLIIALFKKWDLLLVTIFFAPYCASAVAQFSSFFLQPGHFFESLAIISLFVYSLIGNKLRFRCPNILLLFFVIEAFLSIFLSLVFQIDILVYGVGNGVQLKSSLVSVQNFTQYLYLILGFILYWMVFNYATKGEEYWKIATKVFALSGLSVLAIGFYQVLANEYNLPYDEIFRNSVKDMWQTKERVQATFGEASFLGQFCVYLFAIYSTYKWSNEKIINLLAVIFVVIIGVLSRSSGFLLGIVGVVICWLILQKLNLKTILKVFCVSILLMLSAGYLLSLPSMQLLLQTAIAKFTMESWSGVERATVFWHMLDVALQYPIFGIGYGGGRSADIYANLFSNTGIWGVLLFFSFVVQKFVQLFKRYHYDRREQMCILLLVGFLITSFSVPDLTYLPIWVIFGLIDGYCYHKRLTWKIDKSIQLLKI